MDFEIFFSDLNEDAQKRLLEAVGAKDPAEMNWDLDICPIGLYPLPEYDDIKNGGDIYNVFGKEYGPTKQTSA